MLSYLMGRLVQAIPVLIIASIAVFMVLRLVPGDPAASLAGEEASPERVAEIRELLGLNDSLPVQYVRWISNALQGDLGTSFKTGQAVTKQLRNALPPTVELALVAYPLALLIGIPLGVAAGIKPRGWFDWGLSGYTLLTLGIPNFLLGILLIWLFSVSLGWLPAAGRVPLMDDPVGAIKQLIMPSLALGSGLAAALARYTRTSIQETMGQDFIRTARAKGLREYTVVVQHGLRASMIAVITIIALQVGQVLAGAVVIEQVFTRPGVGRLIIDSIHFRDYPVVQGTLLVLVLVFVLVNLVADVAYGLLDPRIRRA